MVFDSGSAILQKLHKIQVLYFARNETPKMRFFHFSGVSVQFVLYIQVQPDLLRPVTGFH